ncbi:MAG: class I SAM-dependent methyltransferase [Planctomycetota bacterium]|nr:class I SAM-dependent methyltransferase [Planctomycetota bacterium]
MVSFAKPRNPGAVIQDRLREGFLTQHFEACGARERLLDLGCATKPFRPLYARYARESVGIDVPISPHARSAVDVFADGLALPFQDAAFDAVLCTEVMEHVPEPGRLLGEIRRVLRSGGVAFLTTPFMVPEHEAPHDFYRYTRYGLRYLAERADLEVVELEPFAGVFGTLLSGLAQVQLKFWSLFKLPFLRSIYNPFVFLLVYLPQVAYLGTIRIARRFAASRRLLRKLSYTPKGYGLLLRRK